MRKYVFSPASVLAVFLCLLTFFLFSPSPLRAMYISVSFPDMVEDADVIFLGRVINQRSRYGSNTSMIFTDVCFEVKNMISCKENLLAMHEQDITLTFAGGEVEGEVVKVADVPSFEPGALYLIFSRLDGKTYASPVIGGFQGLFRIIFDKGCDLFYPLTYEGNCILDIKDRDLITGLPIARILNGIAERKPEKSRSRIHRVPPRTDESMEDWKDARATVSEVEQEIPRKIMSLDEFIHAIRARIQEREEAYE